MMLSLDLGSAARHSLLLLLLALVPAGSLACSSDDTSSGPPSGTGGGTSTSTSSGGTGGATSAGGSAGAGGSSPLTSPCPADATGLGCVLDQYDALTRGCDADVAAAFVASIAVRHGNLPIWLEGRALFVSGAAGHVAGDWNGWSETDLGLVPLCSTGLYVADTSVPSGRHAYKIVDTNGGWHLDPECWAFAYDSFVGNADGRNSVLNTYDSGLGNLVEPDIDLCPPAPLSVCRRFLTYLPAGYGAPAEASTHFPVLFMHDGQNIYDDTDCCFGHTGWEVNVTLDADIADGVVEPVVVVGFPHAGDERGNEYAYAVQNGGHREIFMQYQAETIEPTAESLWRIDPARRFVAGSSFGGLLSVHLMLAYPDRYVGAASLSGAFWPDDYLVETLVTPTAKVPVALYQDWGGSPSDGADGYYDNLDMRALLEAAGWVSAEAPACTLGPNSLCWYWDENAEHSELYWRDRAYLFLRYFFGT